MYFRIQLSLGPYEISYRYSQVRTIFIILQLFGSAVRCGLVGFSLEVSHEAAPKALAGAGAKGLTGGTWLHVHPCGGWQGAALPEALKTKCSSQWLPTGQRPPSVLCDIGLFLQQLMTGGSWASERATISL